jgi:hypothetical protein
MNAVMMRPSRLVSQQGSFMGMIPIGLTSMMILRHHKAMFVPQRRPKGLVLSADEPAPLKA